MASSWLSHAVAAAESLRAGGAEASGVAMVAFASVDGSCGAVCAVVKGGLTPHGSGDFAERFRAHCAQQGRPVRVVAVTRFPSAPKDWELVSVRPGVQVGADVAQGDGSWAKRLHISRSIGAAQRLAEDAVLDIGTNLRAIFELSKQHADGLRSLVAEHATDANGNETIASTVDSLATRVEGVNTDLLARVSNQAAQLDKARRWTHDIVRLGQAITHIASSARMLTFNARIESARIGEAGKGFAVIAGSIQELATQIRQTNDAVGALANNLAQALPQLDADAQAMAEAAKAQLSSLTEQLERVKARLDISRDEAHASLLESTERAAALTNRANQVIEKLQYQDRANQMLDEARTQSEAVLKTLGIDEAQVAQSLVEQVGRLGKTYEGAAKLREPGSVELF